MATSKTQQTRRLQAYFVINMVILAIATYFATKDTITGLELVIFRFFNELPVVLNVLFLTITQVGSAWMLFGLTLLLVGLNRSRLALRVFGVGATAFIVTETMKNLVTRARPGLILDDVLVRDYLLWDYGFPSGHTAVATAIGLVMIGVLPRKWHWLCWLGIVLVGVSRLYLGVHAPLDVVGGFAVGVIVVTSSLLIRGKLSFVRKITRLKLQR